MKSTGLFAADPVLKALGATTDYWKTGHSYIKRRVADLNALAGFEKSGHFFFNAPVGRGYDDGIVTAIAVLDMLDRNPAKTMAGLYADLPKTWGSPPCPPIARRGEVRRGRESGAALPGDAGEWRADRRQGHRGARHRQRHPRSSRRTAPGASSAPPPTSRSSSSWSKARSPRRACARCSGAWTQCSGASRGGGV